MLNSMGLLLYCAYAQARHIRRRQGYPSTPDFTHKGISTIREFGSCWRCALAAGITISFLASLQER